MRDEGFPRSHALRGNVCLDAPRPRDAEAGAIAPSAQRGRGAAEEPFPRRAWERGNGLVARALPQPTAFKQLVRPGGIVGRERRERIGAIVGALVAAVAVNLLDQRLQLQFHIVVALAQRNLDGR